MVNALYLYTAVSIHYEALINALNRLLKLAPSYLQDPESDLAATRNGSSH